MSDPAWSWRSKHILSPKLTALLTSFAVTLREHLLDPGEANAPSTVDTWGPYQQATDALFEELARLEEQPAVQEWVPISMMLPAYEEEVLVTDGKHVGHCYRGSTDAKGEHWYVAGESISDEYEWKDVTAWMPAPKARAHGK